MISNFQTLNDSLVALGVLVGVVAAFAGAFMGAGALAGRNKARHPRPGTPVAVSPAIVQDATQADDRQLVLR